MQTERRRLELLPEDLCRQLTQAQQEVLLPDLLKHLEDFRSAGGTRNVLGRLISEAHSACPACRQKRSMGLTLAEDELSRLDTEPGRELSDRELSCAEHLLSKIEDLL